MSSLQQWQTALAGIIDADSPEVASLGALAAVPGPSPKQGCQVYRNNSRGVRGDALLDVYPVCRRLIGQRSFDGLTRRFVQRVPSDQGDLNRFGEDFGGFVAETVAGHADFAGLPWLGDLVRLEWLCHTVYYRDDDPPLDLGPLQSGAPSLLCPRPASCLAWMRSPWAVHQIWEANRGHDEPPAMQINCGDWYLVVERQEFQVRVRVVDAGLWALLDACRHDMTLGELAADTGLDVSRMGELVQRRWIGSLEYVGHVV